MDPVKQIGICVDQATSLPMPSPEHYQKVLELISSRVDMPKNVIAAISKRLSLKKKQSLFLSFDLLEYLSYRCQLSLYSQIATKDFLMKTSGLLMASDVDQDVRDRILKAIKCWEELFRPHEDLLPFFFQFIAGVYKKDFPMPKNYVSPYRPNNFQVVKKPDPPKKVEKTERPKERVPIFSVEKDKAMFEELRTKIIVTNDIITEANPAEGVKGNALLLDMIQQVKESEKKVNKAINENPDQKIIELALALNDDILITYRRFKDLQSNRRPEPFVLTEMISETEKVSIPKPPKIQPPQVLEPDHQLVSGNARNDIFSDFENQRALQSPTKKAPKVNSLLLDIAPTNSKISNQNLFNLIDIEPPSKPQEPAFRYADQVHPNQANPVSNPSDFDTLLGILPKPATSPPITLDMKPSSFQTGMDKLTTDMDLQSKVNKSSLEQQITDLTDWNN